MVDFILSSGLPLPATVKRVREQRVVIMYAPTASSARSFNVSRPLKPLPYLRILTEKRMTIII